MPEPDCCAGICVMLKSSAHERLWMSDQSATSCRGRLGFGPGRVLGEHGDRDRARIFDVKATSPRGSFRIASLDRLNDIAEFGEAGCKAARLRQSRRAQHRDTSMNEAQHFN